MGMEELKEKFEIGFSFKPSPVEAVTYYLPRLIFGQPMHDPALLIKRADVYGCEPKDLAGRFAPVPKSENGDRFFFTLCKRQKGSSTRSARSAGPGTWVSQRTKDIKNGDGIKVGEMKSFRFKKNGVNTDWLMEEYRCLLQEAVVGDAEQVLCKIYVSPRAAPDSAARQESAAVVDQEPEPVPSPAPLPESVPAVEDEEDNIDQYTCSLDDILCACADDDEGSARQDSAAAAVRQDQEAEPAPAPARPTVSKLTPKRRAPAAEPLSPKRMRGVLPTHLAAPQGCSPAAFTLRDMDPFARSLEEETVAAGDMGPEQQLAVFASDELAMPTMDVVDDIFFNLHDLDGEEPEQHVFIASDEAANAMSAAKEEFPFQERYKREEFRPIFTLDQLEGHNDFLSYY